MYCAVAFVTISICMDLFSVRLVRIEEKHVGRLSRTPIPLAMRLPSQIDLYSNVDPT